MRFIQNPPPMLSRLRFMMGEDLGGGGLRIMCQDPTTQKFLNLVDEVEDGDQVIITKRGVPKAVIVNFEQLQTLKAVARLWQDPEALKAMRMSLDEVKQGRTLKLSGAPTVDRILTAARKKGLLRG